LGLPYDAILVGFYFDYDATQILRDLPQSRTERLLLPAEQKPSLWTNWKDYRLQYVPGQFFSVARVQRDPEKGNLITKPRSVRTINDVKGIFQEPFVRVVDNWKIATRDELELLRQFKATRSEFEKITPEIQRYCETECRLLAAIMTQFRQACEEPNLPVAMRPSKYRGAGYVAARMLQSRKFPPRKPNKRSPKQEIQRPLSPEMEEVARGAYYSGHFEISRTGYIGEHIFFYDCNSAYPAKLQHLPCPVHTQWRSVGCPTNSLFAAELLFQHPADSIWCGFPFRTENGYVRYPQNGSGIYWSPEIEAAAALGAKIEFRRVWEAVQCCDCRWFDWVEALYNYRLQLGSTTKGLPIKLGLNAITGKLSQRIGGAPWHNRALAGLLTSMVRADLIRALAADPSAVVMLATDGLYSTRPLPSLNLGTALGEWKLKELPDMFIVQSGFYWFPGASVIAAPHKTRGISRSIVAEHADRFLTAWREFLRPYRCEHLPLVHSENVPRVPIPTQIFVGLKLAQEFRRKGMNEPPLAGSWQGQWWSQSFDWSNWRTEVGICDGGAVRHHPITGSVTDRSTPYDPTLHTALDTQALLLEAMPDCIEIVDK
jgi:hypothetical protein